MRGRTLILVGLIVVALAVAAGVWWIAQQNGAEGATPELEVTGTPGPPEGTVEILVAAQRVINRGMLIGEGAVKTATWPEEYVPEDALTEIEDVYGRRAKVDILEDMPITSDMITEKPSELGKVGSEAAGRIPEGKVAYALPVKQYSAVAWALQPGDRVDVLISLLVVDIDEEFQTLLPNQARCLSPSDDAACSGMSGPMGRMEVLPNSWVVNMMPSEEQRPRLVTQLTVEAAEVLYVGDWSAEEVPPKPPGAEGEGEETGQEQGEGAEAEVTPTPVPRGDTEPLTLIVDRQDAMVLKYAEEVGASIDLVLRSALDADKEIPPTEAVTLDYLFNRFGIEQPAKLPYGITPAIEALKSAEPGGAEEPSDGGGGGSSEVR